MSDPEVMPPSPGNDEYSSEVIESTPSALAVLSQSEHAAMVTTANLPANRRKIEEFSKKLMAYATHSQPVALSMFYTLPRAGKQIVGPGVRFAEVVAPCWKNNSTGSRVVGATNDTVTAQGVYIDYESNVRNVKEIPRRITDSKGNKFNADMILTTSKAALSIAYREAILKGGVPMALWNPAYEQAKLTAVGQAVSHAARIDMAMDYLTKLGVSEWQIMNSVGCSSPKEMEIDHLVTLKALCEEIKKGVRTIEEVFGSPYDKEIEALFVQLGKNATERGLLKNSYLGRAKELVEELRKRVGGPSGQPVATAQTVKPASTPPPPEQKTEQASTQAQTETQAPAQTPTPDGQPVKRGRGRPRKDSGQQTTGAAQETADEPEHEESAQPDPEPEPQKKQEPTPPAQSGSFSF